MLKPFRFKQFDVQQAEGVFKVGTDACLLGSLVNLSNTKSILEIGSGTGVISLMLAQRNNEVNIHAVDIAEGASTLTKTNFSASPWNTRLSASQTSILDFQQLHQEQFDLIVSNPPFFKDSIKNQTKAMSVARHEGELNLETLIGLSKTLLNPKGRMALILPFQRRTEFKSLLYQYGLNEIRLILIKPKQHKATNRFISEFSLKLSTSITESLVLYNEDDQLTSEAQDILRAYYIKL